MRQEGVGRDGPFEATDLPEGTARRRPPAVAMSGVWR